MLHRSATPFIRKSLSLILLFLLFSFLPPPPASGLDFALKSDTIIRFFERSTARDGADMGGGKLVLPIYEYLRLDYYKTPTRKVSFHAYGWGRGDLADSGYYNDSIDGSLLYGYLEYEPSFQNASIRLGRMPVFSGVSTDYIDGLRYASNMGSLFPVSLQGGLPVGYADTSGRSGDLALGGRVGHHLGSKYEVGLSYQLTRDNSITVEEFLGFDLNLALPADMSFDAFATMNLVTNSWGEQNYALRFNLLETDLKAFFETFSYDDYFSTASVSPQPFLSLASSGETLTRYGLNAVHPFNSVWDAGVKLTGYSYDVQNDTSLYVAGLLTWRGEGLQSIGGELGYLDAKVINNDQLLLRLFAYWDQLPEGSFLSFVSGDIVYASYGQALFGETSSFFTSLGGGKLYLDDRLELKLSGDYSSDPYFDSDLRGMLTLSYRYQN